MQYNTFYIPIGDDGEAQERLNAFLRSHRVLQVECHVFNAGWGFCVEWLVSGSFGERVLHHAFMNVCEPMFDRRLIFDTYACRAGKGRLKALQRAWHFARRYRYYLKCDIAKFFDSIPHDQMIKRLERVFKDRSVLLWFERILSTYETTPGRGLPIGNLTSQHFANLYLETIDRMDGMAYVRYMDDFIFWGNDMDSLRNRLIRVRSEVEALGLRLKESPDIKSTASGMSFLGMRIYPQGVRAGRRSLCRYRRKVIEAERLLQLGRIGEIELQSCVTAMTAFLQQGDMLAWRRQFWGNRREASGSNRVMRGGSWNNGADNCRSSNRNNNPSNDDNNNGFRLFCSAAPQGNELAVPAGFLPASIRGEYTGGLALVGSPKTTSRRFSHFGGQL